MHSHVNLAIEVQLIHCFNKIHNVEKGHVCSRIAGSHLFLSLMHACMGKSIFTR
jgi:hypothetical protein